MSDIKLIIGTKVKKEQLKAGHSFLVSYETNKEERTSHPFYNKESTDAFASSMELMGVTNIIKYYYDPLARAWYKYTDRISYVEKI